MSIEQRALWVPSEDLLAKCNLTKFVAYLRKNDIASVSAPDYDALHMWSVQNVQQFWSALVLFTNTIVHPPLQRSHEVLVQNDPSTGKPFMVDVTWFPKTHLNVAENLLRYSEASPDEIAIIYRPESADDDEDFRQNLTFAELRNRVAALVKALRALGIKKGGVVAGILPNDPNTAIIMLAVFAIGAVWSCCSPDFGVDAIVSRFKQINPVVLFSATSYVYKGRFICTEGNLSKVISQLDALQYVIVTPLRNTICEVKTTPSKITIPQEVQPRRLELENLLGNEMNASARKSIQFEPMAFNDPATCSFSSGTTGLPKCIVHGVGFFLNHIKEHCLHLNMTEDSTVFFYSTTGWMMYNWLVSALTLGATIVLYDGAAIPQGDPLRLLTLSNEENVSHFGCSARYLQVLEDSKLHPNDMLTKSTGAPFEKLQTIMVTGSPSTTSNFKFACNTIGKNVQYVSMSGGTDILGCFALGCPWKPVYAPELQCPGLAMDVLALDDEGKPIRNVQGELVCRTPAPCMPLYFWGDQEHQRYKSSYFVKYGPKVWHHGDFASSTPSGGLTITGRSDTTLNPGGVRIGTGDIYHVMSSRLDVADSVAVGKRIESGDEIVVLFVILRDGLVLSDEIISSIRHDLRKKLSPRHVPAAILQVTDIPYTFSGKKMEAAVKKIVNGNHAVRTDAMRNPEAVAVIAKASATLLARL